MITISGIPKYHSLTAHDRRCIKWMFENNETNAQTPRKRLQLEPLDEPNRYRVTIHEPCIDGYGRRSIDKHFCDFTAKGLEGITPQPTLF